MQKQLLKEHNFKSLAMGEMNIEKEVYFLVQNNRKQEVQKYQ